MIVTGIFGGSGYAGGELLRYLLHHPDVEITFVTSRSNAGKKVADVLPNLAPFSNELTFQDPEAVSVKGLDAVFLGLPHNTSQEIVPHLLEENSGLKILDLAGDFRTPDPAGYRHYYGIEHKAPGLLDRFVYGFTEARREEVKKAQLVANPGCFATSLLLGLWPLQKEGLLKGSVVINSMTGSTGAGIKLRPTTHHPNRATNIRAYKILKHQHLLEVNHFLEKSSAWELHFIPHAGPFARGIFTTFFFRGITSDTLGSVYEKAYRDAPFVRVTEGSPELRLVQDTPFSIVGFEGGGEGACGFAAIDNLAKGTATQAVQNMNLMFGLKETTGLWIPGGFV